MEMSSFCPCMDEESGLGAFEVSHIGAERVGSVLRNLDLCRCRTCGSCWVRCSMEFETSPGWSRWFRAAIEPGAAEEMTFGMAIDQLAGVSWHIYGGAYYRSSGERSSGPVPDSALWLAAEAA